jgi:hypothetical protein
VRGAELLVDAGELPFVQPDPAALGALVHLDLVRIREPSAIQDLVWAAGTKPWFDKDHGLVRIAPHRVEGGGSARVHAIEFTLVKPDAATTTVTDIKGQGAGTLLAERSFTGRTFHNPIMGNCCSSSLRYCQEKQTEEAKGEQNFLCSRGFQAA